MSAGLPIDLAQAAGAAKSMMIADVRLTSLNAAIIQDDIPEGAKLGWAIDKVDLEWRVLPGGEFGVAAVFRVHIVLAGDPVATIGGHWCLDYRKRAEAELSDVELTSFLGLHAFMHAWPYVRAVVQDFSVRLGFPALVLPLVMSDAVPGMVRVRRFDPTAVKTPAVGPSAASRKLARGSAPTPSDPKRTPVKKSLKASR